MRKSIVSAFLAAVLLTACASTPEATGPTQVQQVAQTAYPEFSSPVDEPCYDSKDPAMAEIARYSRCTAPDE